MRVLVTGAAGSIGRTLAQGLPALGHELRGLDVVDAAELAPAFALGWTTGDCLDADLVDTAVADVDAVVHLAGVPTEGSLASSLESHVHTTGTLLDAMVRHGVGRFVYAGSNHAVGRTPRTDLVPADAEPRPDTFYGVSKVAAEAVMRLYVDRHGIDAVSCRIGSFLPQPETRRNLATWLSPLDCVRMVDACLTAPSPGFAQIWGISANTDRWWDLAAGRALGYDPQDDAAGWADDLPPRAADEAEAAFVGGPFATAEHERPAFDRESR
ncbi:MAG: NAD(P)-dependent oxidoreductase [Nocardioidaceae bacterium]|nr:NAD(P)-dependent oxidoreductase [Nocardioidaceae bacterium]